MTTKTNDFQKLRFAKLLLLVVVLMIASCNKEPVNPFATPEVPDPMPKDSTTLDSTSIAGLHAAVFAPTCANSGCHDGTFEPDFRTINSTFNTLVYQPIIKNDPQGSFTYRVLPGQPDQSLLPARLTYDIDGNSGIMPLVIEPGSDYPENKDRYVQWIRTWIEQGARDINGNLSGTSDALPQMQGVAAWSGSWLKRADELGSLQLSKETTVLELYFALTDDQLAAQELSYNKIKFSIQKDVFAQEEELELEVLSSPLLQEGYWGVESEYFHKIVIDPQDFGSPGEQIYFRVYISDQNHPVTEIPANGGIEGIKEYFSFTIVE